MKKLNLIGQRFGKLTVIAEAPKQQKKNKLWRCICDCGNTKIISSTLLRRSTHPIKSCGCLFKEAMQERSGIKSATWKRGWILDQSGYKLIRIPKHHRAKSNGYVREHIVVMEEKLGRRLLPEENVHHLNGIKDDNRLENLELWSRSQPPGQRVIDKINWAKEILRLYGKDIMVLQGTSR